jgi:hypothetical protein
MSIRRLSTWKKKISKAVVALALLSGIYPGVAEAKDQYPKAPQWIVDHVKSGKRCKEFEGKMSEYGLPVMWFTYIAYRESRCRVGAVNARWKNGKIVWTLNKNGTFDSGLFQINSGWRTLTKQTCGGGLEMLMTVDCNMKMAKVLLDNGGLRHWGFRY